MYVLIIVRLSQQNEAFIIIYIITVGMTYCLIIGAWYSEVGVEPQKCRALRARLTIKKKPSYISSYAPDDREIGGILYIQTYIPGYSNTVVCMYVHVYTTILRPSRDVE